MGLSFVGGVPLLRVDVDLGRSSTPRRGCWYVLLLLPSFVDLRRLDGRRDQPCALRPPRGRGRAGRRLPHRVLLDEVRAVLPRRVHQHGDRLGAGHHAVPRRLAGAVADLDSGTAPTSGWWPMLWFVVKVLLFLFFFIWLRGTLPRLRYDQFMKLGWKILIPVSLVWLLLVATVRALQHEATTSTATGRPLRWRSPRRVLIALTFVWDIVRGAASRAGRGARARRAGVGPDGRRPSRAAAARAAAAVCRAPQPASRTRREHGATHRSGRSRRPVMPSLLGPVSGLRRDLRGRCSRRS